jgi:lipoic acid synthetase
MPAWIRLNLGDHSHYGHTARTVRDNRLTTVCEEARCPNRGECWSHGTATFMLLGDTCTRACGFCAVKTGRPSAIDSNEPQRVVQAVQGMDLRYVVLTSVNRDDLSDGGAGIYAKTLRQLHQAMPTLGLEILTPDFRGCQEQAIATISGTFDPTTTRPHLVWGHNIETVPRLYKEARKGAKYERSLRLLEQVAQLPRIEAKSALMLGLGEQRDEVLDVLHDLRRAGVSRIALGQYLRPGRQYLPVQEYLHPQAFDDYAAQARAMGYTWVTSGPMVRSSYHAEQQQA